MSLFKIHKTSTKVTGGTTNVFIIAALLIWVSSMFINYTYDNWYVIKEYGITFPPQCKELEDWYLRSLNNVVTSNLRNQENPEDNIVTLDNNEVVDLYSSRDESFDYITNMIDVGDTLYISEESLLLFIKKKNNDIRKINLRSYYTCPQFKKTISE